VSKQPEVDKLPPVVEQMSDEQFKEWLYSVIDLRVKEKTGRRLTKPIARRLFQLLVELIFDRVIEVGYFRLPDGYKSFTLKHLKDLNMVKNIPSIEGPVKVEVTGRARIRYTMGVTVREKLGVAPKGKYRRQSRRVSEIEEHRDIIERSLDSPEPEETV
jgi:hypothetical protein